MEKKTINVSLFKVKDFLLLSVPFYNLDKDTSKHFRNIVNNALYNHDFEAVIVDLATMENIDGEGLGALIYCWSLMLKNRKLLIYCGAQESFFWEIYVRGLDKLIDFAGTTDESVAFLESFFDAQKVIDEKTRELISIFGIDQFKSLKEGNADIVQFIPKEKPELRKIS